MNKQNTSIYYRHHSRHVDSQHDNQSLIHIMAALKPARWAFKTFEAKVQSASTCFPELIETLRRSWLLVKCPGFELMMLDNLVGEGEPCITAIHWTGWVEWFVVSKFGGGKIGTHAFSGSAFAMKPTSPPQKKGSRGPNLGAVLEKKSITVWLWLN